MVPSTSPIDDPRIVVPIDVSEPVSPAPDLIELLHPFRIVLLGYYRVPDQTALEQMRDARETEAKATLETIAAGIEGHTESLEQLVVFTHDRRKTIERIANEHRCDAVLTPGEIERIANVLVPLRGDPMIDRIVLFVAEMLRDDEVSVTLFHAVTDEEERTESEYVLRGAIDKLVERGIDRDRLTWEQEAAGNPVRAILDRATDHEVIVLGATKPSMRTRILGETSSKIIDRTDRPVLVVRRSRDG